jgi:selenocysteine-specific elongation factor
VIDARGGDEPAPLTLGTAGHVDHGKTALVRALTGVDTDRLAEERRRGVSIELGYAELALPCKRRLSIIDVPGHERFIATMLAGATGFDGYLMVVAANEGIGQQTREHARILRALGITRGLLAVSKSDLADPTPTIAAGRELLGGVPAIACSALTGQGLSELMAAIARLAALLPARSLHDGPPILHIDRCFTITGAGTIVTGTLSSGSIAVGETLLLQPGGSTVRVRALQVHGAARTSVKAGQRVAVNLARISKADVNRGDVLTTPGVIAPSYVIDIGLDFDLYNRGPRHSPIRVHVHHGTRATAARAVVLQPPRLVQLRCQRPLLTRAGDRLVIRDPARRDTLGGGLVMRSHTRHRVSTVARAQARHGKQNVTEAVLQGPLASTALLLEARLRRERFSPTPDARLDPAEIEQLAALRAAGRIVLLVHGRHAHLDAVNDAAAAVRATITAEGRIALPQLRDQLGVSRRDAKAFLDYFDSAGLTLRRADDTRTLRGNTTRTSLHTVSCWRARG